MHLKGFKRIMRGGIFSTATVCLVLFCGGDSDGLSPFASGTRRTRTSLFVDAFVVTAACNTRVPTHRNLSQAKRGRPKGSGRSEEERDAVYKERKEQIKEVLCLDQKQIDKLVSAFPIALDFRVEENVKPKVEMLQERLGIDQKTAGKILSHPFVIGRSSSSILQNIDWLQDRLNLDVKGTAKFLSTNPPLLSQGVETLGEKIQFIRNCLDMTDDEVTELITKYSPILHLSVEEKIPARMSYLKKRFQLDDKSLKEILRREPRLLTMSIETSIEPKLAFYSALIGEKKAKWLVMESTNLLGVSLEKKLKPRLAEVQKLGMKVNWDETLIQRLARRPKERWERYKLEDVKVVRQRERERERRKNLLDLRQYNNIILEIL